MAPAVLGIAPREDGEHSSVEDAKATMQLYLVNQERKAAGTLHGVYECVGLEEDSAEQGGCGYTMEAMPTSTGLCGATVDPVLKAHRASIPRYFAPGGKVALPNMPGMSKGRRFDARTSTYY